MFSVCSQIIAPVVPMKWENLLYYILRSNSYCHISLNYEKFKQSTYNCLKIIFGHIYFSFLKVEIKWVNSRPLLYPNTGFPWGSAGKESTYHEGDLGSIPGLGRSPGEGKGYPLWYSGLEDSMGCIVHGVAKSRTQLRDFHFVSQHSNFRSTLKFIMLYT